MRSPTLTPLPPNLVASVARTATHRPASGSPIRCSRRTAGAGHGTRIQCGGEDTGGVDAAHRQPLPGGEHRHVLRVRAGRISTAPPEVAVVPEMRAQELVRVVVVACDEPVETVLPD
ncbi:hypothetical protein AB8998_15310 [Mycobacterium sp. HUMS_12744610]|uniref:Uncharacterized protein n=1 Tax=Mycobacterium servetii TaxID=3237418 RepID=A0ABV4C153_9MYCO